MISRFNFPISKKPFNPTQTPNSNYKLTKEILFHLFYTLLFFIAMRSVLENKNDNGLMLLGNLLINVHDLAIVFLISLGSLVLLSFLFKYFIIRYNLCPDILYGHILANKPLEVFGMSLVYLEYTLSYKDPSFLANENDYINIKKQNIYASGIYFLTTHAISFNKKFRKIKAYKCQYQRLSLSYAELMQNYESYNLDQLISKESLRELADKNNFETDQKISIKLNYIQNYAGDKQDVIIRNEQFIDNFQFDYSTFIAMVLSFLLILFVAYNNLETFQNFSTLLIKTIQYNLFFYLLLFLTHKKYLFR